MDVSIPLRIRQIHTPGCSQTVYAANKLRAYQLLQSLVKLAESIFM